MARGKDIKVDREEFIKDWIELYNYRGMDTGGGGEWGDR
jgi:hypothetical protein